MVFETLGSRMSAPYFGTTTFVWTALIGTVMIALALGNYLGGRIADRWPSYKVLAGILGVSSINIALIPFIDKYVYEMTSGLDLITGPIVATSLLFVIPATLLGIVSPFIIKLSVKEVKSVGEISGRIYSLSTIGSIAGVITTVFMLIPAYGINTIFYEVSIVLILLTLIIYLSKGNISSVHEATKTKLKLNK
jgi:MFS family permease